MNRKTMQSWRAQWRIVRAITAKDLVDGLHNKSAFGLILSALFVLLMYRYLPNLTGANDPLSLLMYDAGDTVVVPVLENSPAFRVRPLPSEEAVVDALAEDGDVTDFGLVIPADYNAVAATGGEPQLVAYAMRWAGEDEVQEALGLIEEEIAAMTGIAVHVEARRVELLPGGVGGGLMPAMGMVFVSLLLGMLVPTYLMLEEKQAKTLAALLVSPASAGHVVLGKALAGMTYALLGVGVAFALNRALINHWALAVLTVLPGVLFSVSLGLLLGSVLESPQQVMLWAWVLLVPLLIPVFLSIMEGLVPAALIRIFRYLPTVALFDLFRMSFAGPVTLGDWGPRWLLVAGWAAVTLTGVALYLRKTEQS